MNGANVSSRQENLGDAGSKEPPCVGFRRELRAPLPSEAVQLRATTQLGLTPFGLQPAAPLHPVERRIQRAFFDDDGVVGGGLDERGDRIPVQRTAGQGLEDEGVERAVQQGVGRLCSQVRLRQSVTKTVLVTTA
jgi:hypothetical protein